MYLNVSVCAKSDGDTCGGFWDFEGHCGMGLKCQYQKESRNGFHSEPGVCISDVSLEEGSCYL